MVLLLLTIPYGFLNPTKPIYGPESVFVADNAMQYFVYHKAYFRKSYLRATSYVNGQECRKLGLFLGPDDWEFPIWKLLKSNDETVFRIRHIGVTNVSRGIENSRERFESCLVLTTSLDDNLLGSMGYRALKKFGYLNVYEKAPKAKRT
jgi:hypothetical protein